MTIKIGVLVPTSNYIPFLSRDLPQALQLGLRENPGIDFELCIEPAGYNADKNVLIARLQDLVVKQQVDIVTAPLNMGLISHLQSYCCGLQVPLMVNTLGEDVLSHLDHHPYLLINSFNLWQTSWLTGYWAAQTYGKTAASLAALHDGGYGITFAFALGVEAQSGTLVQAGVTHRESRESDPTEAIQMVAANHPDFIMGFYSGKETVSFLKAYQQLGYQAQYPLVGLPFTVDESLLDEVGELALGIKSLSCWRRDTVADQNFTQKFQALTGHPVHCYVLMAYETGQLIARAVQQLGTDQPSADQLMAALQKVEFQSPRGLIRFDPDTREVATQDYLREVVLGEKGQFYNKVLEAVEAPPVFFEQLAQARKTLPKVGWLNPYLIA